MLLFCFATAFNPQHKCSVVTTIEVRGNVETSFSDRKTTQSGRKCGTFVRKILKYECFEVLLVLYHDKIGF